MQAQMDKLAELDPEVHDMMKKRLELGWSIMKVADLYCRTQQNVMTKERYALMFLRRACNGE